MKRNRTLDEGYLANEIYEANERRQAEVELGFTCMSWTETIGTALGYLVVGSTLGIAAALACLSLVGAVVW